MLDIGRLSRAADRGLLFAGDLAALVLFAAIGRRTHDEAAGLDAVASVAGTALPFLLGWLAAVLLLRAASEAIPSTLDQMLRRTARLWVVAFPIAVLLRALFLGRGSAWSFYLVAFVAAFVLLAGWRTSYLLLDRRLRRRPISDAAADHAD